VNPISCTNHHLDARNTASRDSLQRLAVLEAPENGLNQQQLITKLKAVSRPSTMHSVIAEPASRSLLIALKKRAGIPVTDS
jgi:hypothetical protein